MAERELMEEILWAKSALAAWLKEEQKIFESAKETSQERRASRTDQLGELGAPEAGGDDAVLGHPVAVDVAEGLLGGFALGGLEGADEDAVGAEQVGDGGALGQELGVAEDVEAAAGAGVGFEDGAHGLGGAARDGGLLDDDLGGGGHGGDVAGGQLDVAGGGKDKGV